MADDLKKRGVQALKKTASGKEKNTLKEGEEVGIIIELGAARKGQLNESFLYMLGGWVETLLGRMFGMNKTPFTIKGTRSEIDAFGKVLNSEKRYIDSWHKYGLDDERTYANKGRLQSSINQFERATGLRWPFGH